MPEGGSIGDVTERVPERARYVFGDFEIDAESLVLRRNGRTVALTTTSRRVLLYLVRSGGRLVSKAELTDAIWPNTHVAPNSVSQALWEVRRALRERPDDATVIETVRSRGYRFLPSVERIEPVPPELGKVVSASQLDMTRLRSLLEAQGNGARVAQLARRLGTLDPEDLLAVLEFVWLVATQLDGASGRARGARFTETRPARQDAHRSVS